MELYPGVSSPATRSDVHVREFHTGINKQQENGFTSSVDGRVRELDFVTFCHDHGSLRISKYYGYCSNFVKC